MRRLLENSRTHSAIAEKIAGYRGSTVDEVEALVREHDVVVVGMTMNPFPARTRKLLDASAIPYKYIGYGSYLAEWRKRLALKMWTGWPTFPMIFVRGTLIGGFEDLERLLASGEFKQLLAGPRPA
jgi:monothiol glutaredoxin